MPLDDHTLILQLERATEALKDEVEAVADEDRFADIDHGHDELAYDSDLDRLSEDIERLEKMLGDQAERIAWLEGYNESLKERIAALEAR
jgi:DNA repair exonuclease SbcCD ATPase subunit